MFEVKRTRPSRLTADLWTLDPARMKELLAKDDELLDWSDYQRLLLGALHDVVYEESVYFLPRAFSRLLRHPAEASELAWSVAWFSSEYASELRADGDLESVRTAMLEVLDRWTGGEDAIPRDPTGRPLQEEWQERHFDCARRALVLETLSYLVEYRVHADLAADFLRSRAEHAGEPVKAAWFLEFVCRVLSGEGDHLPAHMPIVELVRNEQLQASAAKTVREKLIADQAPSQYWQRCFELLSEYGVE